MRPKTLGILEVLGWYFYDLGTLQGIILQICENFEHSSPFDYCQGRVKLGINAFFRHKGNRYKKTFNTNGYFKPIDTLELLHKKSHHPNHTFKGIIKSQILRYVRICNNK